MNIITAIIIDDEEHNRNVLKTLLTNYCPTIKIIAEAQNADEGFDLITDHLPQLVFLDVKMPKKSGFDLLRMFDTIDFEVIFVSAFNEYAVTAFEFNALGYILKPIDYYKLIASVNKAILKINLNIKNESVLQFIKTIEPTTNTITKIPMHHNEKVELIDIVDIVSIEMIEGISTINVLDNKHYRSSKNIGLFENMLKELDAFIRVNKNTIINLKFLKSYHKGDPCLLLMKNGKEFEISRRKKSEVLAKISHLG